MGGVFEVLATNTLARDTVVTVFNLSAGLLLTQIFTALAAAGLKQTTSRKLVHIFIGVTNLSLWPLWSRAPYSRYFAALVPGLFVLRMLLVGTGVLKQPSFVNSITRDGRSQGVLRGPLLYTLALLCAIVLYWREGPIGMTAVSIMSGGDGAADLVGRRFGSVKLPWNKDKSWAGSIAMFLCGWGLSVAFITYFQALGYYECTVQAMLGSLAIISGVSTVVESLPINKVIDDNISVPLVAAGMGHLLFSRTSVLL